MEEEKKEKETQETTTETEETEVEEEVVDEDGNKKEPEKYSENEKKLYARIQKMKEKLAKEKLAREKLEKEEPKKPEETKKPENEKKEEVKTIDEIGLAKRIKALQDYDDEEIEFAEILSKGTGKDILDVIKTEQFITFSTAHQDKIKKDKLTQTPNGKQGDIKKKDEFFEKFSQNLPRGYEIKK